MAQAEKSKKLKGSSLVVLFMVALVGALCIAIILSKLMELF